MLVNLNTHITPPDTSILGNFDICNVPISSGPPGSGGSWIAYSKDDRIYILVRHFDHTWDSPIMVTKGHSPFISYDENNDYVSIVFEWNNKIQRLSFLAADLGFFQEPLSLWDCTGLHKLTAFSNFDVSQKLIFACHSGTVSQEDRKYFAKKNCLPMVSCVTDWPGAQPTPQDVVISGGDIEWTHVPEINGMERKYYRIYKNGSLVQEVSGIFNIKEFVVEPLNNYAVTSVYTWSLTKEKEHESCKEYNDSGNFGFGQDSVIVAKTLSLPQASFQNIGFFKQEVSENFGIANTVSSTKSVFQSYFITKYTVDAENCLPGPSIIGSTKAVFHSQWPIIIT